MNKLTLARTVSGLAVLSVEFLILEKARIFSVEKKHAKAWATAGAGIAVGFTGLCLVDEVCKVYRDQQLKAKQPAQPEIEAPALIEA